MLARALLTEGGAWGMAETATRYMLAKGWTPSVSPEGEAGRPVPAFKMPPTSGLDQERNQESIISSWSSWTEEKLWKVPCCNPSHETLQKSPQDLASTPLLNTSWEQEPTPDRARALDGICQISAAEILVVFPMLLTLVVLGNWNPGVPGKPGWILCVTDQGSGSYTAFSSLNL